jgi:outer membrane lipoprotein-sorting protein
LKLPEIKPMSMGTVTLVQQMTFTKQPNSEKEKAKLSHHSLETGPPLLENENIRVVLDKKTFFPREMTFKKTNDTFEVDMSLVYYSTELSNSGAYLFSPYADET